MSSTPTEKVLSGGWDLRFPAGKGAPASAHFSKLISWPDSTVDGIKYFSGTATYHTSFSVGSLRKTGASYWLDLGRVKNLAVVSLNGHTLPTLWKAPFRVDATRWLRAGKNDLVVKVTNLWPNRLIGDERYPPDAHYNGAIQSWPEWIVKGGARPVRPPSSRVAFTTWQFFSKDSPLLESGLIGPVKLVRVPVFVVRP